jgi:hypothetical protein
VVGTSGIGYLLTFKPPELTTTSEGGFIITMTDKHRIYLLRQLNKEYLDIIKKQALIIESAGIIYPTINQSLGHIQQIYQASKKLDVNNDEIKLEIPII